MKKSAILLVFFIQCCFSFSQSGKIFTTSSHVIECSYIKNKRFGVEYISVNSTDNTRDYIPHSKIDRIEYENGAIEYISGTPEKDQKKQTRKDPKDFTYINPSYVSVNIGPALPFPGLDFYSPYAGNEERQTGTGVQVCVDAMYTPDLLEGFGFGAFVGYTYNPFNPDYFTNTLLNQLPANANNVNIKTLGWNNIYFLGGADYYFELSNRFILDAKVMVGGMYAFHPTATAIYDTSGLNRSTTLSTEDLFLCFGVQASARYFITRKFSIKASIDGIYGNGGFSKLTRKDYENSKQVYSSVVLGPVDASIAWFGITLGVAYTLGK